jgi:hypothetical protein
MLITSQLFIHLICIAMQQRQLQFHRHRLS